MFKSVQDIVWAYDIEWVPDPVAGRVLLRDLAPDVPDEEVVRHMWSSAGASDENPRPYLKTVMCRIVSIVAVQRRVFEDGRVSLDLLSLPRDVNDPAQVSEAAMIGTFLDAAGRLCPQLVGFNSSGADIKILLQRAVVHGLQAAQFCSRPDKPWEGVDYFARESEYNIDLMRVLGGWGKATPSLHEMATLSGIPGKMDVGGGDVADLWLQGAHQQIVDYNECDAISTYLLWLRVAHLAGKFSAANYQHEQDRVRALLESETARGGKQHLRDYLAYWNQLDAWMSSNLDPGGRTKEQVSPH